MIWDRLSDDGDWAFLPAPQAPGRGQRAAAANVPPGDRTRIVPGSPGDPCADLHHALAIIARILTRFPEAEQAVHAAIREAAERWNQGDRSLS